MKLFTILLTIHITCGSIAFVVAPIAMAVKKGGNAHRRWGKIFFWCMTGVAITALIMAPMKKNLFLTLVAVFSFYLTFSGYRVLYRKNPGKKKTAFIDWFFAVVTMLFSLALFVFGVLILPNGFGIISMVFGFLGVMLALRDVVTFIRPPGDKRHWFFSHMTGMIAGYIAAVSAFSAVNLSFEWLPVWIQWLWPTLVGTPLLMMWTSRWRKRFSGGKRIGEVVEVRIG